MSKPHIIALAKFTRDLLGYDETLIKFDREDTQREDLITSYIVINDSAVSDKQFSGREFDQVNEIMNYNESYSQSITMEFYGNGAYENATRFGLITQSQKASDLKRALGLTISRPSKTTDVKQLLGGEYGNRIHLEMNINYSPSIEVETLRVDTAIFEFNKDN